MFDENGGLSEKCVKFNSVSMSMVVFQWLFSWLKRKVISYQLSDVSTECSSCPDDDGSI